MKTGTSGILSKLLYRCRVKEVKKYIKNGNILEVGCGGWPFVNELKRKSKYVGLDIDEEAINRVKNLYPDCLFIVKDIEKDVVFSTNKFKNIIMLAVLEHLKNPIISLVNLSNNLCGDGRIILTTPSPKASLLLKIGSKLGLFDKSADKEHETMLGMNDFQLLENKTRLKIKVYKKFLFGLNQIVVLTSEY